jgi:hypothetical protein
MGRRVRPAAIPDPLLGSPLMQRGGFAVVEGLLSPRTLADLLAEAQRRRQAAQLSDVAAADGEEGRGGRPARRFWSTLGGEVQAAFYRAPGMAELLSAWADMPVGPTGSHGSYSYYDRAGAFLGIHRDIETCDLAVITCLCDRLEGAAAATAATGEGGSLCLYPGRSQEPLSAIRRSPGEGTLGVRLKPGQTLVLLGGIVPHAVLPVAAEQARVVSVLCYRAGPGSTPA